mmetsp:Transcript_18725/g.34777  ORF Transcript_18725/g.34777 Transcript_18725/m.34777 type:complete len:344 (-) Transcript_18725:2461-3492(-)
MTVLLWIIIFGLLMSCIALVGGITLILREELFKVIILPLVAFAAGSLIGGATFHMIPAAVDKMGNVTELYLWLNAGFVLFYALEEFLHWHHSHTHVHGPTSFTTPHDHQHPGMPLYLHHCEQHEWCHGLSNSEGETRPSKETSENLHEITRNGHSQPGVSDCDQINQNSIDLEMAQNHSGSISVHQTQLQEQIDKTTLNWLILVADGLHNLLGGMFVGASFLDSIELGLSAWIAAAAHEIPQELGDFAILVHGGWSKKKALLFNFFSALAFPLGGLIAYTASKMIEVSFLVPFAAGNFLYIGASDLIPEIKHHHGAAHNAIHFVSFTVGLAVLLGVRIAMVGW